MESPTITIGISKELISPNYRALWDGAVITGRSSTTDTMIYVQLEPPPESLLERQRQKFETIEPLLSEQSRAILETILMTSDGLATRQDLIDDVWLGKETDPSNIRKAVNVLNAALKRLDFGYVVKSRKGFYCLNPITR